ncbi:MAG: DUF169 domain-containing protein [Candidatus Helarchaeota archaeon]
MTAEIQLSNSEIDKSFRKYMHLKYKPLGIYFSKEIPPGKVRFQGRLFGRCIVGHVFKASKKGCISIIKSGAGCPGGQFWSGFSKKLPRGWAYFITHGREDILGGRAEHFKKNTKIAIKVVKDPGPLKLPNGINYIIYQRLGKIPDKQKIEYILFFLNPKEMAKFISLVNYARHCPYMVRAPAGSGCMSLLCFPLKMEEYPIPDAVMGIWDCFARNNIPKNILSIAVRRWIVEEMTLNMPESFLAHTPPFTIKGEIIHFFKKTLPKKFKS